MITWKKEEENVFLQLVELCTLLWAFLGVTVIVYVQDSVSWGVADLILTITLAITVVTFYLGKYCYRYRVVEGSPLMPMLQVLVAAIRKRNLPNPPNPDLLFEVHKYSQRRLLLHTNRLRFLDRAAIIEGHEIISCAQKHNPWRLATLTRVEGVETSLEHGSHLANLINKWKLDLGWYYRFISMSVAALVERKRLRYADPTAMSVFWLAPQYMILGIGDALTLGLYLQNVERRLVVGDDSLSNGNDHSMA
ncbi:hypothetical protein M0R45_037437 [Rubus argutus]|uniref:Uncharacterized protein n=1 Tax=Rubus argutus TaxID=59490 RepID=A0AAW1W3H4_RUBAR